MLRHRLADLFEPRSLVVACDRRLPCLEDLPPALGDRTVILDRGPRGAWVAPGGRLHADQRSDLALVCVQADALGGVLRALSSFRPRAMVVLAPGAPAAGPDPAATVLHEWGHRHDCLVLGPGSFGFQRPVMGLNLSRSPARARGGRVALLAQSPAIVAAVMDWAADVNLGFSLLASTAGAGGVSFAGILDYLAMDTGTDSIVLVLDALDPARQAASALLAAAGTKPVIVLKSHPPGSDPDHDRVVDALLRRTGAVRVREFVELFSAIKVLAYARRPRGARVALLANDPGPARLALNVMGPGAAAAPAELSMATRALLADLLGEGAAVDNPVVPALPLPAGQLHKLVQALTSDPQVDGILVLLAPDPFSDMDRIAAELASVAPQASKPVVSCFLGDAQMRPLRHLLDQAGTPAFRTPESAAVAFGTLASYHDNQILSQQTLPPEPLRKAPDLERARALLRGAVRDQRLQLEPAHCLEIAACFHIPLALAPHRAAATEGPPYETMAIHLLRDPSMGPYLRFGPAGGGEEARVELPPLNAYLARQLLERSPIWRRSLSLHFSSEQAACVQDALERLSDLASELPALCPVLLEGVHVHGGCLYAEAIRMEIAPALLDVEPRESRYAHMAFHPYPRQLVRMHAFPDGQPWIMRPIRPEDALALQAFIRNLSDRSRYMRFVSMLRELTPAMLARYTRIDYDRELALVATVQVQNPADRGRLQEQIAGFAHYLRNADGQGAEYALVIGDDWQRRGLGRALMQGLIHAAREQGLAYIEGLVLANNRPMLALMAGLDFRDEPDADDPAVRLVRLDLRPSLHHAGRP